jgi:hypothetical protein
MSYQNCAYGLRGESRFINLKWVHHDLQSPGRDVLSGKRLMGGWRLTRTVGTFHVIMRIRSHPIMLRAIEKILYSLEMSACCGCAIGHIKVTYIFDWDCVCFRIYRYMNLFENIILHMPRAGRSSRRTNKRYQYPGGISNLGVDNNQEREWLRERRLSAFAPKLETVNQE